MNEKLREARVEVDKIVGQLKQKADALGERVDGRGAAPRLSTGDVGSLRADARAALGTIAERLDATDAPNAEPDRLEEPPNIGQTVFVSTFGTEGIVRGTSGQDIDVEIRGKRLRVKLDSLRVAASASPKGRRDRQAPQSPYVPTRDRRDPAYHRRRVSWC